MPQYRVSDLIHGAPSDRGMSSSGPGRVKTKSDLVVALSGGGIFADMRPLKRVDRIDANDPEQTRAAQFCVMHNTAFFNDVVGCSPRRQARP
jgi:hypothetical protein